MVLVSASQGPCVFINLDKKPRLLFDGRNGKMAIYWANRWNENVLIWPKYVFTKHNTLAWFWKRKSALFAGKNVS
jgi:hypothetical protein